VGPEGDGSRAAPTFPLPARRDPVLARLSKASSALRDQLQLLLQCPFPPGAAFISCEALALWEPSHPASSWLNDRPIKAKPIKPQCKNGVRAGCLPISIVCKLGLGAGGGRDTPSYAGVTPESGESPQLEGQLLCSALGLSSINFSQCGVGFFCGFFVFISEEGGTRSFNEGRINRP